MADPIAQPNIDITGQKKSPADYIDTNKIAEALNVKMEGVPGAPDISKIRERVTTPQAAISELGTLEDQQQRLRQNIGQLESAQSQAQKIGESGVAQYAADQAKQIQEGRQRIVNENPLPKFIPTQENVQSLSTLFSLLGVIAVGGGSKNKLSAMGALNSMTGMLKGWREGRADLWKQEQVKFEKDMAQVKANLDDAAREADLALKMLPYDVRKAEAMMQELVAKTGSSILTEKAKLQGVQEAVKYIKELQAGFKEQFKENLETRRLDIQEEKIAQQEKLQQQRFAHSEEMQRRQFAQAFALLDAKLQQKDNKPIKEKEAQQIEGLTSLSKELRQLEKEFKPEYASLGLLGFGADLSMEAKRRLGNEEGAKAVQWWSKYERLQAPNRHALFGATLTGNELKNYQSFTAKKSDDPTIVRNMLLDQADYSDATAQGRMSALERAGYKVPEVKPRNFLESYSGQQKVMPSGEKLKSYAKEHFGGDEKAAKDYLSTQGYK